MSAYYNEHEPYAAQWLRNLIAKGLIADGEVDERSIVDVSPDDVRGFSQAHFFAGIGGWSHALRLAGWPDERRVWTGSCPCQPFSVAGKGFGTADPRHLWPHFHRLIRSARPPVVMGEQVAGAAGYGWFDGVAADLEAEGYASRAVDVPACAVDAPHIRSRLYWVASDMADSDGSGRADERGARLQRQHVYDADGRGERDGGRLDDANHARLEGHARDEFGAAQGWSQPRRSAAAASVRSDMADADCQSIRRGRSAEAAGAAQAYAGEAREQRFRPDAVADGEHRRNGTFWSDHVWLTGADGKARRAEPSISLLAHGLPARVGRLRAYGNAIVPQLAAEVIAAFMEARP